MYRPHPGRLHPVLFLHGGGFVIGGEGYDSPLRELAFGAWMREAADHTQRAT